MKEESKSYRVMVRDRAIAAFEQYLKETGLKGEIEEIHLIDDFNMIYIEVTCNGFQYFLVPANTPSISKYLACEPLGYVDGHFIFPLKPRERAFFFTVFSETYGFQEFGPFNSYHKANIEIHKLKGRINQRNDGVYRYFSEAFERPQPPQEVQIQDPLIQ
jgi:hypothetical protein